MYSHVRTCPPGGFCITPCRIAYMQKCPEQTVLHGGHNCIWHRYPREYCTPKIRSPIMANCVQTSESSALFWITSSSPCQFLMRGTESPTDIIPYGTNRHRQKRRSLSKQSKITILQSHQHAVPIRKKCPQQAELPLAARHSLDCRHSVRTIQSYRKHSFISTKLWNTLINLVTLSRFLVNYSIIIVFGKW